MTQVGLDGRSRQAVYGRQQSSRLTSSCLAASSAAHAKTVSDHDLNPSLLHQMQQFERGARGLLLAYFPLLHR